MARSSANLRLFAAIYPPADIAGQMLDSLRTQQLPSHRLTPVEQLHMTVQFIGDTAAADLDATIESVERAAAGLKSFELTPIRLITLPERGPARLIAAETDAHPSLIEIHRRLVVRLAKNVRAKNAERFRPHFTLCRFRSPAHRLTIDQPLTINSFAVHRLSLMRSSLSHEGAIHHELATFPLIS